MNTGLASGDLDFLRKSCGRLWLDSAKAARKSGNIKVSFSALIHAEKFNDPSAAIERAKFLHSRERQAMKSIDFALKQTQGDQSTSSGTFDLIRITKPDDIKDRVIDRRDTKFIRAKAQLLKTQWMDMTSLVNPKDIIEGHQKAVLECEHWEKSYYIAGQYYSKLYESGRQNRTPDIE